MTDLHVSDAIRYIGADDTTIDLFESQYVVPNGVSYNSYVIVDEKTAIMDTVDPRAEEAWVSNLEEVLEGAAPEYLVVSHLEPDHAGSIRRLAEKYPQYRFEQHKGYGTKLHYQMLDQYGPSPIHRLTFLKKWEAARHG